MTLLILTQPGAIIDIYWERLIVAVICLNYSGARETGDGQLMRYQGSRYRKLLVKWIAPCSHRHCNLM